MVLRSIGLHFLFLQSADSNILVWDFHQLFDNMFQYALLIEFYESKGFKMSTFLNCSESLDKEHFLYSIS
jgi:hypothetical protein